MSAGIIALVNLPRAAPDGTPTGGVLLPRGTTAQRPTSPTSGLIRFNTTTGTYEFYDGTTWVVIGFIPMAATGGVLTSDGTFNYHTFTGGSADFTVTTAGTLASFEFFAWGAGGGGGGSSNSRQGGAGGCGAGDSGAVRPDLCEAGAKSP
jgi:hypothetical protein